MQQRRLAGIVQTEKQKFAFLVVQTYINILCAREWSRRVSRTQQRGAMEAEKGRVRAVRSMQGVQLARRTE